MRQPLSIDVLGEQLLLHPGRAVIWPRRQTVIVADTHFGKSGFFGRHGIAVPDGSDEDDRNRVNRLIAEADARRLVILGDFVHAPGGVDDPQVHELRAWAQLLSNSVAIHVVAGNHDRGAARDWQETLQWWDTPYVDPPFEFIHDADCTPMRDATSRFSLSGHIHPVVRLRGAMKRAVRVPVFWQRATGLVLPSFGLFTGGYAIKPGRGERLYGVGSHGVVRLGPT